HPVEFSGILLFLYTPRSPSSTPSPYTTLFRSPWRSRQQHWRTYRGQRQFRLDEEREILASESAKSVLPRESFYRSLWQSSLHSGGACLGFARPWTGAVAV